MTSGSPTASTTARNVKSNNCHVRAVVSHEYRFTRPRDRRLATLTAGEMPDWNLLGLTPD